VTRRNIEVAALTSTPIRLDHAGIAARIPHAGSMCLLDAVLDCDADRIRCRITSHADPANPLRDAQGLAAPVAIEYAAQAMALHGALAAEAAHGGKPSATPGFLASARQVRMAVPRLDTASGPLEVQAVHLAGDGQQALYRFVLADRDGHVLVEGRAAVVLNSPLPLP
jgi:predicted hotdog family 3-hydroxylacyl-ACP dehydratase